MLLVPRRSRRAARESAAPAQPASAPDNRPVIVAFGDSLTAGFGADTGKSYPDFLQQELDRARLPVPRGKRGDQR